MGCAGKGVGASYSHEVFIISGTLSSCHFNYDLFKLVKWRAAKPWNTYITFWKVYNGPPRDHCVCAFRTRSYNSLFYGGSGASIISAGMLDFVH